MNNKRENYMKEKISGDEHRIDDQRVGNRRFGLSICKRNLRKMDVLRGIFLL